MWQRKFTCELSSEVIKSLHLEYDVDLDVLYLSFYSCSPPSKSFAQKAQEEVNKIVPIATVNNFGAYIRTHGVPQDLGVDAEVAEMIVDAVKIIQ